MTGKFDFKEIEFKIKELKDYFELMGEGRVDNTSFGKNHLIIHCSEYNPVGPRTCYDFYIIEKDGKLEVVNSLSSERSTLEEIIEMYRELGFIE